MHFLLKIKGISKTNIPTNQNPTKMCDAEYYEGCCERCEETKQVLENYIIGETICDNCFDEHYGRCDNCDDKFCLKISLNEDGWCEGCVERDGKCEDCEEVC